MKYDKSTIKYIVENMARELAVLKEYVGDDGDTQPRVVARPKPPKPKTPTLKTTGKKFRKLPPEVLNACRSIKYRAKKRKLDVVPFVRNPNLCEKRNSLQLKLSQPVKDYFLKWSAKVSDASIRKRFNLSDLNKKRKGGK